jgi:hypothetical protein
MRLKSLAGLRFVILVVIVSILPFLAVVIWGGGPETGISTLLQKENTIMVRSDKRYIVAPNFTLVHERDRSMQIDILGIVPVRHCTVLVQSIQIVTSRHRIVTSRHAEQLSRSS